MSTIKGTHDLSPPPASDDTTPASDDDTLAVDPPRSKYCYILGTLADEPKNSRFLDTDDATTLQRLKDFETSCHLPFATKESPAPMLRLPAAYTYFGQFMNHDISAPIGGLLVNVGKIDPEGVIGTVDLPGLTKDWRADVARILEHFVNEHALPLTLSSLYGEVPNRLEHSGSSIYEKDGRRFCLGETSEADKKTFIHLGTEFDQVVHAKDPRDPTGRMRAPDIPRIKTTPDGKRVPLIADPRNDGNLILSQLHLAFMLVHNKAVDALEALDSPPADCFGEARQLVTLHYHWLILNDFLPRLLSKSVVSKPLSEWSPKRFPDDPPIPPNTVPMEFTTAAFRFGHSMVGRLYDFNENFGKDGRISTTGATLLQLFDFTSHGTMGQPSDPPLQLPDHWVIDWDRMTKEPEPGAGPAGLHGQAEQIDLDFAPEMLSAAGAHPHGSILQRNLLRGFHRLIPFGQHLAKAYDIPALTPEQVLKGLPEHASPSGDYSDPAEAAQDLGFLTDTPAWLYMMCEAKVIEHGERVGATASHIIADTVVSLMRNNPSSVLRYEGGGWHPRDSLLRDKNDLAIESIRAFLLFATERTGAI